MQTVGHSWTAGMMSSLRQDWATPRALFEMLDREFHFTIDLCADGSNAKCPAYFDETDNALAQEWRGVCWLNPPYSRQLGRWIHKAYCSSQAIGSTIVCLVPARTDTKWFHDFCLKGEIRFLRGRLRFDDIRSRRCPFPSMIVVFRPQ